MHRPCLSVAVSTSTFTAGVLTRALTTVTAVLITILLLFQRRHAHQRHHWKLACRGSPYLVSKRRQAQKLPRGRRRPLAGGCCFQAPDCAHERPPIPLPLYRRGEGAVHIRCGIERSHCWWRRQQRQQRQQEHRCASVRPRKCAWLKQRHRWRRFYVHS